ncbi:MAG: triose-phosphate isomerase [Coriobacteriales bacterium]|jgi:triosephosphate isomerase|nr:triose-phosphate isomerase [Coriobacteriales bacterium]
MTRKALVAGNWKMNKTTVEAAVLGQDIVNRFYKDYDRVDTVLCPPFVDLKTVRTVLEFDRAPIALGAQDVFWEKDGAYTGAISPVMLKEVGCTYGIVGHSERREHFAETDLTVSKKAQALLEHDIAPIICVGEGLEKREEGAREAIAFVTAQVSSALELLDCSGAERIVIAYEPIWAIGTGRTATPEAAQEMCAAIRAGVADWAGSAVAQKIRVLYGGSMKPENAALFAPLPDVDGGLIGGAALEAQAFIEIVKAFL